MRPSLLRSEASSSACGEAHLRCSCTLCIVRLTIAHSRDGHKRLTGWHCRRVQHTCPSVSSSGKMIYSEQPLCTKAKGVRERRDKSQQWNSSWSCDGPVVDYGLQYGFPTRGCYGSKRIRQRHTGKSAARHAPESISPDAFNR